MRDLTQIKTALLAEYRDLPGLIAAGVGNGIITLYIKSTVNRRIFPQEYQGIRVEVSILSGDCSNVEHLPYSRQGFVSESE